MEDVITYRGFSIEYMLEASKILTAITRLDVNDGQTAEDLVYSEVKPGFHLEKWYPTAQGRGSMKSLIRGNYHFIADGDGREELFDWKNDPDEKNNLVQSEGSRPVLSG